MVRLFVCLLASVLLTTALVPDADAGLLKPPAADCPVETLEQRFTRWSDHRFYALVPDGGFENGAQGWLLRGATVVRGNQTLSARTDDDAHALALHRGGRATSPTVCIGVAHPTIRFFARNTGSPLGLLAVEVVAKTSLGPTVAVPIGVVAGGRGAWAPSYVMPLIVNLLTITGGEAEIALRFTAVGSWSSWEIDDVYVDPYSKR